MRPLATFFRSDRTVLAFLVAPLWVPIATAIYAVRIVPYAEQRHGIYMTTLIGALFGYGAVWAIGFPAFRILRARGFSSYWAAIIIGFVVALLTWHIFKVLFALSLGNSLSFVWQDWAAKDVQWALILTIGALGSVVGGTLWLIARPDRFALGASVLDQRDDSK